MSKAEVIPIEIINMVAEATSNHNDGWTKARYKDKLITIRNYINEVLRLEPKVEGIE